jgi:type IV secretory pathway VirB4 component
MYLNFRVRQSIDGRRRVIQVFDEFHQYLDDPIMSVEVKRGLKQTVRKMRFTYSPRKNRTMRWIAPSVKPSCSSA